MFSQLTVRYPSFSFGISEHKHMERREKLGRSYRGVSE